MDASWRWTSRVGRVGLCRGGRDRRLTSVEVLEAEVLVFGVGVGELPFELCDSRPARFCVSTSTD